MRTEHQISLAEAQLTLTANALDQLAEHLQLVAKHPELLITTAQVARVLRQHAADLRALPPF